VHILKWVGFYRASKAQDELVLGLRAEGGLLTRTSLFSTLRVDQSPLCTSYTTEISCWHIFGPRKCISSRPSCLYGAGGSTIE
jgi:hypothetical protein